MVPRRLSALIALVLLVGWCEVGTAGATDYNQLSLNGEAIAGFDVMAYWQGEAPTPGSRAFSYEWRGAVWLFASSANLAKFKTAPEHYAPAVGGYCAYAMSKGIKADIHPFIYKIADGKLFLFYSFESRDKFLADPSIEPVAENEWTMISQRIF